MIGTEKVWGGTERKGAGGWVHGLGIGYTTCRKNRRPWH